MRKIAILGNFVLLGIVGYETARSGVPRDADFWLVLAFAIVPIFSLIALMKQREDKGWLSLLFKRKALEELRRIEELKKNTQ